MSFFMRPLVDVAVQRAAQQCLLGSNALMVSTAHQATDESDDGRTAGGQREPGPGQQ